MEVAKHPGLSAATHCSWSTGLVSKGRQRAKCLCTLVTAGLAKLGVLRATPIVTVPSATLAGDGSTNAADGFMFRAGDRTCAGVDRDDVRQDVLRKTFRSAGQAYGFRPVSRSVWRRSPCWPALEHQAFGCGSGRTWPTGHRSHRLRFRWRLPRHVDVLAVQKPTPGSRAGS
jgi:hypothetical protein